VIDDAGGLLQVTQWLATALSLALGALLAALMQGRPHQQWLACLSLLPLFLAIRTHRGVGAMICGAMWGGCLSYFCSLTNPSFALPSVLSVVLVVAAPAVYAGFAARLTAAIGFNPLILGLGWVFVEAILASAGFPRGLLAAASAEYPFLAHISNLLGYLFVAFLGAWANASLLAIFSRIRISISGQPQLLRIAGHRLESRAPTCLRDPAVASTHWLPRAPPLALPI
jgi:apolipoprotein N-acyltransferase